MIDLLYSGQLKDLNGQLVVPADNDIRNIIFSVGTNDIRKREYGVSSLYIPLRELLRKTKMLFPNARIHIQSLIPMGYEYRWTPSNVVAFNKMAQRCARDVDCSYIDIFDSFLTRRGPVRHPNRSLFNDLLHPSPKGAGIIARAMIGIVRN